jgi:protease-4
VAQGRSLQVSEVEPLADGRVFTGRQAKDIKLVDEIGNLDDAIRVAAEMGGIEGEPKVVEPRRRFSIRELVESRLMGALPRLDFQPGVRLKYLMAY